MNSKTVAIVATAMAFILALCVVVPVSEESEAADYSISDSQSLKETISTITNAIAAQPDSTTSVTYNINITGNIEVDSLDLDFGEERTEGKKYTVNLNIGTKEDPKTLTLSGTETGPGITIANNGLDSITISIRYGNIVDNRTPTTDPMSTISVQGPGDGTGTTNATLLNMSVSSTVPSTSESNCILSVSDGASVTLNSAVLKTNGNDETVGVSMEPNTGSKTTTLKTYNDTLIESPAQGILTGVGKTSISLSGNTHIDSTGSNAIQQDEGTLSVSNANIVVEGAKYAISKNAGNLTISGGLIKGTIGAIENTGTDKISTTLSQSGGVFSSDISGACDITSTYSVVKVGDRFHGSFEGEEPVASIGDAKYSSISYVNAALHSSDADSLEVTLLSNTNGSTFTPLNDVIINLNGYNLTLTRNDALVVDGFSVEITGTGTLSLSTLSILGSDDPNTENYSTLKIGENVTVNVTNAIIIGEANRPHGYGVVVDIDGKIDASTEQGSKPPQGITVNGTLKDTTGNTPVINVNGEILAVNNSHGIYAAGYATWNIYGKVSGGTGIEIRAGNVNVYEGSTIASTASKFTVEKNSDGTTMIGAGIAVSQHTTNLPIALNIKGGNISGPYALYEKDLEDDTGTEDIGMDVTGGTFTGTISSVSSENVKDFLAGGTFLKQKDDGTTEADTALNNSELLAGDRTIDEDGGVTLAGAVAKIGSVEYATLAEAFAAARDGDTVNILTDIVLEGDAGTPGAVISSGITIDGSKPDGGTYTISSSTARKVLTTVENASFTTNLTIRNLSIINTSNETNIRCLDTRGLDSGLVLENVSMTATGGKSNSQPLTIGGNTDETLKVSITDCSFDSGSKGYCIIVYNAVDMDIIDSSLKGWNAVTMKYPDSSAGSKGSTVTISDSVIDSNNSNSGPTDQYAAIVVQDVDIEVVLKDVVATVGETGGQAQRLFSSDNRSGNTGTNTYSIGGDGTRITLNGDNASLASIGASDSCVISGGTFNRDVSEYLAPGFTLSGDDESGYGVDVAPDYELSAQDVTILEGQPATITPVESGKDPNAVLTYTWTANGETVGSAPTLTVTPGETTTYTLTVTGTSYGEPVNVTVTVTVTVVESVNVTFVVGEDTTVVTIPAGTAVPGDRVPELPDAPEHYAYQWDSPVDQPFYDDFTVTAGLMISDLEVTVEIDGSTATAVIDTPVEYTGAEYYWLYNDGSDEPNIIGMEDTQTLDADGQYALLVVIVDADGIFGTAWFGFEYTAESDLPPFIPFPPEQGGDPVEVYPSGDGDSSSDGGDGTLKVVAVAAAAVIAAFLIVVWASTYRKD